MKYISLILFSLLAVLAGCTNHGDIGPLYGQWVFDSITVDGAPLGGVNPQDFNARFENNIVQIAEKIEAGDQRGCVGVWSESGHILTLDLTPTAGSGTVPAAILLEPAVMKLDLEISGKKMRWTYTDASGRTVRYSLHKLM